MQQFSTSLAARGAGGSVQTGDRSRFSFRNPTMPPLVAPNAEGDTFAKPTDQFRPIFVKTGVVSQAAGSAYIEIENTKVICAVYGPRPSVSGREFSDKAIVGVDFKYASWSGSSRRGFQADEAERETSQVVLHALERAVIREAYPKSCIDVNILVLQDDGCVDSAAITCSSLALTDAGVEQFNLVAACTVGCTDGGKLILDPARCDAPSLKGVVMLASMDSGQISQFLQAGSLSGDQLSEAISLASDGCSKLHELLKRHVLESTRATLPGQLAKSRTSM